MLLATKLETREVFGVGRSGRSAPQILLYTIRAVTRYQDANSLRLDIPDDLAQRVLAIIACAADASRLYFGSFNGLSTFIQSYYGEAPTS